jgi:hypothetical protein
MQFPVNTCSGQHLRDAPLEPAAARRRDRVMMPGPLLFTASDLYDAIADLTPDAVPDRRLREVRARLWNDYEGDAVGTLRELLEAGHMRRDLPRSAAA